jgi:hypothetical protein
MYCEKEKETEDGNKKNKTFIYKLFGIQKKENVLLLSNAPPRKISHIVTVTIKQVTSSLFHKP